VNRWIWLPAWVVLGCGGPSVPASGPCSVAERAAIGARYEAAVTADCADPTCPHFAELTAKRDAERKVWLECSAH
jgi:hypothetical protein